MGKGARSSSKKAVRAQRRAKPVPAWQEAADARRYAALAAAVSAPPMELPVRVDAMAVETQPTRGRKAAEGDDHAAMQTDASAAPPPSGPAKGKGKRKVVVNARGVQKKRTHNPSKKVSPLWVSEFHKGKKGKKGKKGLL